MSRWMYLAVFVLGAGAAFVVSINAERAAYARAAQNVPRELLQSRLKAARKVFEMNMQRVQSGVAVADIGMLSWSQRWLDAELAMSDARADRIAAIKAHLERAKEVEKIAAAHVQAGQGREVDEQMATYFRIDAEIQLSEATSE
jgi:hypothetical protein